MRPTVLSIAGFDPCGGAGLLADCKTISNIGIQSMSICTAITFQNERQFVGLDWVSEEGIFKQLNILSEKYTFEIVKVGIIESWELLDKVLDFLMQRNEKVKVILDPVLSASAGYEFHKQNESLVNMLRRFFLITPNWNEMQQLFPETDPMEQAKELTVETNVFLKGGHNPKAVGTDYLFYGDKKMDLPSNYIGIKAKHGSGCVLSSAIAAYLAYGNTLKDACSLAKAYTARFLASNESLLGHHS